jgi:hypothetical protein
MPSGLAEILNPMPDLSTTTVPARARGSAKNVGLKSMEVVKLTMKDASSVSEWTSASTASSISLSVSANADVMSNK